MKGLEILKLSSIRSVAGAVSGVAATGGAATLATCPTLMISTLGHGLVKYTYRTAIENLRTKYRL